MKTAQVIHNPSAGNAAHEKEEIMEIVRKAGYTAEYISMENRTDWENFDSDKVDTIFLAGGDGTVHKLAKALLEKMKDKSVPIHLLPLGTANNIARTLQISRVLECHAVSKERSIQSFDCGRIIGLPNKELFIESIGFGVFPDLIYEMERNTDKKAPSDEIKQAIQVLSDIVKKIKPQKATIKTDGITIQGKFLLVELMNIQYLGPNIKFAPHANPGDGYFELSMIPEKSRKAFGHYLSEMINGT